MKRPRIVVFDFDGVMTDNAVWISEDGKESVRCNRADGLGCAMLRRAGISMLILSTEKNPVVAVRAKKLGIPVLQGKDDKLKALKIYCKRRRIALSKVMYAGNDVNDYQVMKAVGFSVCPRDSHRLIRSISKKVLKSKGGDGVVREIAEEVLGLRYPGLE